jgi:hypothetical protein
VPFECPTNAAGTGPFLYVATGTCMDTKLTPDTTSPNGKRRARGKGGEGGGGGGIPRSEQLNMYFTKVEPDS